MTPAGWLTGRDLVYRVSEALHAIASSAGKGTVEAVVSAKAAEAVIGLALSQPRPSLGAFVRQRGEWFAVPSRLWADAIEAASGPDPLALSRALLLPCLPASFEGYSGQVALYGAENAADFVARLSQATPAAVVPPTYRDAAKPWRDFRSVSAWLSSRQSTRFIDERLAQAGNTSPRPIDRDRALFDYLQESGEAFTFEGLQSRRRPSRMTD